MVYFVRQVLGMPVVSKEVLSQRTNDYRNWVEAFARNQESPWNGPTRCPQRGLCAAGPAPHGATRDPTVSISSSEAGTGRTFRITVARSIPTQDPNHRILAPQRSRFTHFYFYIRDEVLGPIIVRVASFFPFHATYWLNGHSFIEQELKRNNVGFQKNDNAFLAVDDVAALQAAADRLSPKSSVNNSITGRSSSAPSSPTRNAPR